MEKPNFKKICLMHLQALTNFPYIEKDFDALTDYELLCKVVDRLNQVISNNNEQNTVVENLYNAFVELKEYVDNYFDNLDVQEEINNKLDEMLEDGVLEQIIEQFLQLTSLICFDNVSSMKESPNLTNGSYAKTLGYYSKNDGGGALYKIRNVTNVDVIDEGSIIALNDNTLIAELIIENSIVNVKEFGAKGNNIQNDTLSIQNAINYANNKNISVFIPSGTYLTNDLNIYSNTVIYGEGINSILKSNTITNALINIIGENIRTVIKDIHLYGDNKNGDAILINHNNVTLNVDSNEQFINVKIEFFNGLGINLSSENIRSVKIINCDISNCGNGIYIKGTDNFISDTISYWNKGYGIYIQNGSSNKIDNTKCFGNSTHGFYIKGSVNQISNCESQDNYYCGMYFEQCWGNVISNSIISTNGVDSTNGSQYSNVKFYRCYNSYIDCVIVNRNTPQALINHSEYGVELVESYNIKVNAKLSLLYNSLVPFKYNNPNVSNKIDINGVNYGCENYFKDKKIGVEGETQNLSQIFTGGFTRNFGSFEVSEIKQSQIIKINDNTTIDANAKASVYTEIDISDLTDKSRVSFYWSGSNTAGQNDAQCSCYLNFVNSVGGLISSSDEMYAYNGGNIDMDIPENTTKIRIWINYLPLITNLNKQLEINNFQVGIY